MSWKSVVSIKHENNYLFCSGSSLATSGSTIIGENTGVFVGGLPQGYTIVREDVGEYDCGLCNMANPIQWHWVNGLCSTVGSIGMVSETWGQYLICIIIYTIVLLKSKSGQFLEFYISG